MKNKNIPVSLKDVSSDIYNQNPVFFDKYFKLTDITQEWLAGHLDLEKSNILDFGCGNGETSLGFVLRKRANRVVGVSLEIDKNSNLPREAKEYLGIKSIPSNLEFCKVESDEIPVKNNSFDLVFSWSTLGHVNRNTLGSIISELKSKLKPNGFFFVQIDPLYYSPYGHQISRESEFAWSHLLDQTDEFYCKLSTIAKGAEREEELKRHYDTLNKITAEELISILKKSGFSIIRQYRTKAKETVPEQLTKVYKKDLLVCEQIVLLCQANSESQQTIEYPEIERKEISKADQYARKQLGNWWATFQEEDSHLEEMENNSEKSRISKNDQVDNCIREFGELSGFEVLEVGPRDGYHTYELEKNGVNKVISIENNLDNYIRCCHIKNQFDLKSRFILGDAEKLLSSTKGRFDLVFLAGVLYHMKQPLEFLDIACKRADRVYIWTHYYDRTMIELNNYPRRDGKILKNIIAHSHKQDFQGYTFNLYKYEYEVEEFNKPDFSGGANPYAYWLSLPELKNLIEICGMKIISQHISDQVAGPAVELFLRKK